MQHCPDGGGPLRPHGRGFHCQACGRKAYDSPAPAVILVLHDGRGRILCARSHRHPEGVWALVAGFVERGETAEEAAVREALEETGLAARVTRILGTYAREAGSPGPLMIAVEAIPVGGTLRPGDDVVAAAWFPAEAAPIPGHFLAAEVARVWLATRGRTDS